jgi:V/A-type H+-transporting ATPase subunit D
MQRLKRELSIREKALPTLKAKETALRLEVRRAQDEFQETLRRLSELKQEKSAMAALWLEFPALLSLAGVELEYRNIAGVRIPELKKANFAIRPYALYLNRAWVPGGVALLQRFCQLTIEVSIRRSNLALLEGARKKTTQKVNLYEKVQIPEYKEALLKIKRYLEDQENLAIAAQKLIKEKKKKQELAGV